MPPSISFFPQYQNYALLFLLHPTPRLTRAAGSHGCGSRRFHGSHLGYSNPLPTVVFRRLRLATTTRDAKILHGLILLNGLLGVSSPPLGSQLVGVYAGLGALSDSLLVFRSLPVRNTFAWNSVLKGMIGARRFWEAVELFRSMLREGQPPDGYTYPLVLKACSATSSLEQGLEVYRFIMSSEPKLNAFVQCALVDMFAKCGGLCYARKVFDQMSERDLVTWTTMICGTTQNGSWFEALYLFRRMRLEGLGFDAVIMATVIPACGRLGALFPGMCLHGSAIKGGVSHDLCVSNALIDMYSKCGHTDIANSIFRSIKEKDVISWSSMIAGYSQNCQYSECFTLFNAMIREGKNPTSVTLASVLPALSEGGVYKQGREIHAYSVRHGFDLDTFVACSLIDLYGECNTVEKAESIFSLMACRDIAIWNSLIAAYALNWDVNSAFKSLRRIHEAGFKPNSVTIVTVLPLCNHLTMLRQGKELHSYVTRNGLGCFVSVNNSLIDMYSKCGCLDNGRCVFEHMACKDTVTYNTIIAAVGTHGNGKLAISLFHHMRQEKIKADKVTFIALLSACSHGGFVAEGAMFYNAMMHEYNVLPEMEHFSCMADLYGRSGYLEYAWDFIMKMPMEPDIDVLGSLLGACRVHGRMDLAELVGQWIFKKKPADPGYYILLSNIYASSGRWLDVRRVRRLLKNKCFMKKPGNSWIQIEGRVHSFCAEDRWHPRMNQINEFIGSMLWQMKDEGYIPDITFFSYDLSVETDDMIVECEMDATSN